MTTAGCQARSGPACFRPSGLSAIATGATGDGDVAWSAAFGPGEGTADLWFRSKAIYAEAMMNTTQIATPARLSMRRVKVKSCEPAVEGDSVLDMATPWHFRVA